MKSAFDLRPSTARRADVIDSSQRPVRRPLHRSEEQGFAILVVMLMAAAIAFSLYMQMPRYAFETMRQREQTLMDRGNQYKRAIQVYYAENKHYPAKLEDLENTNDKRYLRRRYRDPLTGSDEWRLIHTNGSALTDSLVQKPPVQNAANGTPGVGALPGAGPLGANNLNTAPAPFGGPGFPQPGVPGLPGASNGGQPEPTPVNAAVLRRPSDRLSTVLPNPAPGLTQENALTPGLYPPGYNPATYNPNDPSTWPPITLAPVNQQPGQPTGQPSGAIGGGNQGVPSGQPVAGQPISIPGFGGQPSITAQQPVTQISPTFGDQTQGVVPTPLPFGPQTVPGSDPFNGAIQPDQAAQTAIPGQGAGLGGQNPQIYNPALGFQGNPLAPNGSQQQQPGVATMQSGVAPAELNPALQAINARLSNPSGAAAAPLTNAQQANSSQMAPGIAGVASKFEGASIKVYNKRSKYKEWEFVFDPSTASTATQPANGQTAAGQNGLQNGQGNNGGFNIPGFGSTPGQPQQPGLPQQPGQSPFNATPSASPFGQPSNPFGAPTQ